ncbi:hypothetical protein [uncultured Nostoc sp.]|uniref:hypothetical protein n=1 Tax=uncultured Nostoc sp. TaxID=340711 RepID=UPI0035C9B193|nr:hypothetical protein [Nostoc sp. NMS8]
MSEISLYRRSLFSWTATAFSHYGGHLSFKAYCEKELTKHVRYRRVRDLLSAKKVVDTLPEELRVKITNSIYI